MFSFRVPEEAPGVWRVPEGGDSRAGRARAGAAVVFPGLRRAPARLTARQPARQPHAQVLRAEQPAAR